MTEIATVSGIRILLLTVELWRNQTVVRLAGQPTWRDDPDPEIVVDPAEYDGHRDLGGLHIYITDDVHTKYRMTTGSTGGTDVEWRADWFLRPGVPPSARRLFIRAVAEQDNTVELSLE